MSNKTYTSQELRAFGKELQPYYEKRTLNDGKTVNVCNFNRYLVDQRIISYRSAGARGFYYTIYEARLGDYIAFQDKYDQLSSLRIRTEYAKNKELEAHGAVI